ncbi:hypothetical protein B0H11DRAFT_1899625 [Mycena galericulata]|nr:hypothetical protein B0H11DRAFT_1899625 [Mycena galericulata]
MPKTPHHCFSATSSISIAKQTANHICGPAWSCCDMLQLPGLNARRIFDSASACGSARRANGLWFGRGRFQLPGLLSAPLAARLDAFSTIDKSGKRRTIYFTVASFSQANDGLRLRKIAGIGTDGRKEAADSAPEPASFVDVSGWLKS